MIDFLGNGRNKRGSKYSSLEDEPPPLNQTIDVPQEINEDEQDSPWKNIEGKIKHGQLESIQYINLKKDVLKFQEAGDELQQSGVEQPKRKRRLSMKTAAHLMTLGSRHDNKNQVSKKRLLLSASYDKRKDEKKLTELEVYMLKRGSGVVMPTEIFGYFIFLIMISALSLEQYNNQDIFYLGDQLKVVFMEEQFPFEFSPNRYKMLKDVATVKDLHQYLQGVLYPILYHGATFNGKNNRGRIFGVTYLLGSIRIGTNRVKTKDCGKCIVEYGEDKPICFPKLKTSNQDIEDFGIGKVYKYNRVDGENDYTSMETLRHYPPPTHNVFLPRKEGVNCTLEMAYVEEGREYLFDDCPVAKIIYELEQNEFIDEATRSIVVDLTVHHPELDKIVLLRVFFEQKQSGTIICYAEVDLFKSSIFGKGFVFILNIGLLVQAIFYTLKEMFKMFNLFRKGHWQLYLLDLTNISHLINLGLLLFEYAAKFKVMQKMPKNIVAEADHYYNFRTVEDVIKFNSSLVAFNVLLTYLQVFKYLSFTNSFALVSKTLGAAQQTLFNFMISMLLILVGFAMAFMQGFGAKAEEFRNFQESFYALFRAMLMDFSLSPLRKANLWLGPLLSCLFESFAIFVLLNIFIAIILDGYSGVKKSLESNSEEGDVTTLEWIKMVGRHMSYKIYQTPFIGRCFPIGGCKTVVFPISTVLQTETEMQEMQDMQDSDCDSRVTK